MDQRGRRRVRIVSRRDEIEIRQMVCLDILRRPAARIRRETDTIVCRNGERRRAAGAGVVRRKSCRYFREELIDRRRRNRIQTGYHCNRRLTGPP